MVTRTDIARRIVQFAGDERLSLTAPGNGWPSRGIFAPEPGDEIRFALWAAPVTLTHRDRDDVERRIQNPGQQRPIVPVADHVSIIAGLWEEDSLVPVDSPVLMIPDSASRAGASRETRFSIFVKLDQLQQTARDGWVEGVNNSQERILCIAPALLPLHIEASRDGLKLDDDSVRSASSLSQLHDEGEAGLRERLRREVTQIIRDARFRKTVVEAYGSVCAMCGLTFEMIEGAHVYPVSAPGSSDAVWNGIALCRNHHAAFDHHDVWVDPDSLRIQLSPRLTSQRDISEANRSFVDLTRATLLVPYETREQPRPEMFRQRYAYFDNFYDWRGA